jgi:hypothetical protein
MFTENMRVTVVNDPVLHELLHTANALALEGSRQAAVLAAAVFAGFKVWGPPTPSGW